MGWISHTESINVTISTRARARACLTMDVAECTKLDDGDILVNFRTIDGKYMACLIPKGLIYDPLAWSLTNMTKRITKILEDIIKHGGEEEE